MSLSAWAQTTWTAVGNESTLKDAIANGAHIRLANNITLSNHISIYGDYTVTIDLDGHTLSRGLTEATYNGDVIEVYKTGSLTMMNGTLTGGYNNRTDEYSPGCIYNNGTVTLTDVTITGCKGDDGGAIRNQEGAVLAITGGAITGCESLNHGGGAIVNYGTANISNCSLNGNTASTRGGAIWSNGTLTMSGCTIDGNEALDSGGSGGGLHIENGTATLTDVTISRNTSKDAGGIYIKAGATLNLGGTTGSTISGNTSSEHGGGGITNHGTLSLTGTVSITGNTCHTNGGGIWNNATGATLNMQGTLTVKDNVTDGSSTTNIYLDGSSVITVTGEITSGSSIGLRRYAGAVEPYTYGFGEHHPSLTGPVAFFIDDLDSENYRFVVSGELFRCLSGYGNDVTDAAYVDDNGNVQTRTNCIRLSSITDQSGVTLYPGWYVVDADMTFNNRITALGEVHLILANGTVLTAKKGIYVPYGSIFHTWGQTDDKGTLEIKGIGSEHYSGIGGDKYNICGGIRIHGGNIIALGGGECPGIGGVSEAGIVISGGTIFAQGYLYLDADGIDYGGAGIGGSATQWTPDILITGGSVIAIGGNEAAGIGGGCENVDYREKDSPYSNVSRDKYSTIRITGGYVYGWGTNGGAGIGGGATSGRLGEYRGTQGFIYIDGGTINAFTSNYSHDIGHDPQAIGHGQILNQLDYIVLAPRIYDNAKVSVTTDVEGEVSPVSKDQRLEAIGWNPNTFYKKAEIKPCDHNGANIGITDGLTHSINCTYCTSTSAAHVFGSHGECDACHLVSLADRSDNSETISHWNGSEKSITLTGRTLYKDLWNTVCLPFDVDLTAEGPLKGVTAKTLSKVENDGTTVKLTFGDAVERLVAGTPYIVSLPEGATENLVNPIFKGVTISNELNDVTAGDGTFKGTYTRVDWSAGTKNVLFLQNNKFFYPNAAANVNAFRAYIQLKNDAPVSAGANIIIDFGDDDVTGIEAVVADARQDGIWYTLQGIPLDGKPTEKGIYILNGRKVAIQ